jgi:hypothetical protein
MVTDFNSVRVASFLQESWTGGTAYQYTHSRKYSAPEIMAGANKLNQRISFSWAASFSPPSSVLWEIIIRLHHVQEQLKAQENSDYSAALPTTAQWIDSVIIE